MVSKHDDFVGDGAIDDADDVPQGSGDVLLLVDEVELEGVRRRPDVVMDALVSKSAALPVFVE
jgi:hypothetical protein